MASWRPVTSISEQRYREIFGNSDEELDENGSDIDVTGFYAYDYLFQSSKFGAFNRTKKSVLKQATKQCWSNYFLNLIAFLSFKTS